MTTTAYKTIFLKDLDNYPGWQIKEKYDESAFETICTRSNLPIAKCELNECANEKTHKSRPRVSKIEKAVIFRTDTLTVP